MYQDVAGTTPVTAAGQPVGLMLDKRLALARGPELLVNGDFSAGASNWAVTGTDATHITTFSNGLLRYQSDTTSPVVLRLYQSGVFTATKWYESTVVVPTWGGGSIKSDTLGGIYLASGPGVTKTIAVATTSAFDVLRAASNTDITIDSISTKEIYGYHASQATTTARPTYQQSPARRVFDGVDDVHTTSFPGGLGANCTIGRAIPGVGAQILTGQNIGTSYSDTVTSAALVIINRSLSAYETRALSRYLNTRAGV